MAGPLFTRAEVLAFTESDAELRYKLNGYSGRLRIGIGSDTADLLINDAHVVDVVEPEGVVDLEIRIPLEAFGSSDFLAYGSAFRARRHGVEILGNLASVQAPYSGAIERLYSLLRTAGKPTERPVPQRALFKSTDTAVGRYVYVEVEGIEYRVYYEESGTGGQALLLQHTAGGDSRQWRHQLADPEFQKRFRVIAYDLPYHGRSLPPTDQRWWEGPYKPTKEWLEAIVLALADALGLEDPFFMGCSVGGQLALDLAADHGDRFGAFFALNGTLNNPMAGDPLLTSRNDRGRDNRFSNEQVSTGMYNASSPLAPEAYRREIYFGYKSNFPGVYAGDNDYFLEGHDLTINGSRLDELTSPLYVLAGEFDPAALDPVSGAPAVARLSDKVDFRELKNLSHFAPTDDPELFNQTLIPILDEALHRVAIARTAAVPQQGMLS